MMYKIKRVAWVGLAALAIGIAPRTARAADATQPSGQVAPTGSDIAELQAREAQDAKRIDQQSALLAAQADELAKTKALVELQQKQVAAMKQALDGANARLTVAEAATTRAGGAPSDDARLRIDELDDTRAGAAPTGGQPVGEAPPTHANQALALPLPQLVAGAFAPESTTAGITVNRDFFSFAGSPSTGNEHLASGNGDERDATHDCGH